MVAVVRNVAPVGPRKSWKPCRTYAAKHQLHLHPNQVGTWKREAIEGMTDVFLGGSKPIDPSEAEATTCMKNREVGY